MPPVVSALDDRSGTATCPIKPLTLLRDRDGNQPPADWEPEEIGGRSEIVDQRPGAAGIKPLQGTPS